MKKITLLSLVLVSAATLIGCASAPTTFERKFFDIETNLVARVMVVTNVAPLPGEIDTNLLTTVPGSPMTNTTVPVRYTTNRTVVTNFEPAYVLVPNTNAWALRDTATRTTNLFGPFGDLVGVLLGGVFGVWGWLRSQRAAKTAGVLAQVIETGREILQSTPQGRAADEQWKAWMIQHQAEHGVIMEVIRLVQGTVDTPTARETAAKLLALMQQREMGRN